MRGWARGGGPVAGFLPAGSRRSEDPQRADRMLSTFPSVSRLSFGVFLLLGNSSADRWAHSASEACRIVKPQPRRGEKHQLNKTNQETMLKGQKPCCGAPSGLIKGISPTSLQLPSGLWGAQSCSPAPSRPNPTPALEAEAWLWAAAQGPGPPGSSSPGPKSPSATAASPGRAGRLPPVALRARPLLARRAGRVLPGPTGPLSPPPPGSPDRGRQWRRCTLQPRAGQQGRDRARSVPGRGPEQGCACVRVAPRGCGSAGVTSEGGCCPLASAPSRGPQRFLTAPAWGEGRGPGARERRRPRPPTAPSPARPGAVASRTPAARPRGGRRRE